MRFDSGGLKPVLDDMKNARRMAGGEIQVRHDVPFDVTGIPTQPAGIRLLREVLDRIDRAQSLASPDNFVLLRQSRNP